MTRRCKRQYELNYFGRFRNVYGKKNVFLFNCEDGQILLKHNKSDKTKDRNGFLLGGTFLTHF
jgi:hypothetical protein